MSLYQAPPDRVTVECVEYAVDTDFRVWMELQSVLSGEQEGQADRIAGFLERLGLPVCKASLDAVVEFYTAESQEKVVASRKACSIAFDFRKDSEYIYAAFMGAYGIDLTTAALHWWTFKALFKALPEDCELCRIMRYRTIELKDVPKEQRRFYAEQKARYSLGKKTVYRTENDMRDYVKRRFQEAQRQLEAQESPRG